MPAWSDLRDEHTVMMGKCRHSCFNNLRYTGIQSGIDKFSSEATPVGGQNSQGIICPGSESGQITNRKMARYRSGCEQIVFWVNIEYWWFDFRIFCKISSTSQVCYGNIARGSPFHRKQVMMCLLVSGFLWFESRHIRGQGLCESPLVFCRSFAWKIKVVRCNRIRPEWFSEG